MRRWIPVVAALVGVLAAGLAGTAQSAPTPPSAALTKTLGSSGPIACAGSVGVTLSVTGHAGAAGVATDIELVLDISGSIAGQKLLDLKAAATSVVHALDAADGADDGTLGRGNRVGIVTYRGSSATVLAPLQTDEGSLVGQIGGLSGPSGGSPHAQGIQEAAAALAASTTKGIVLITDGLDNQAAAGTAATAAKSSGIRIVTVGVGSDADAGALGAWATQPSFYQQGSPGPIDAVKAVADLGAAVAVPVAFTVTETTGSTFAPGNVNVTSGSVTGTGPLVWTGVILDGTATLTYTATRNGSDPGSVTEEDVSTTTISVSGGTGTVTPATAKILVLPCDGQALLDQETCTGGACSAGGTQGGVQYSLDAGSPPAGTQIFVTALSSSPPAGVCAGFDSRTNGVQFDVRPLSTPGNFEIVVPKAALGGKKWWQADVCVATNMRFITAIGSLANLRPGATLAGTRWWGLLPSFRRIVVVPGVGPVVGPWITSRRPGANGSAIVRFTMPYVAGSESATTDGLAAFDPRVWVG